MYKPFGTGLNMTNLTNRWPLMLIVSLMAFTPLLLLSVTTADAAPYLNCGSSEAAINSSPNTLWCDDFEDGDFVADSGSGSDDGWSHTPFAETGTYPDPGGHAFGRCRTAAGVAMVTGLANTGVAGTNCAGSSGTIGTVKEQMPSQSDHVQPAQINYSNRELYLRYYKKCVTTFCHTTDNTKICCNWETGLTGAGIMIAVSGAFPNGVGTHGAITPGVGVHKCDGGRNCQQMHLQTFVGDPSTNCTYGRCAWQNVNIATDDGTCAAGHTCYEFGDNQHHWYYIEHHIRYNSASGVADGVYELWMDDCGLDGLSNGCATGGTLRTRYTNMNFGNNTGIGAIWLEQHGGSCPCPTQSGEYYFDQFVASKVRVGPVGSGGGGGGGDTTPPVAPTGLRIQ